MLIFFNFHVVQSIALQCKSIAQCIFFKNGAKYTMWNRLHSKSNRLHQWKKWIFVNFSFANRDFRKIIPEILICQMLRLGTYKTKIYKDKDKYFFVFLLEVSQQHIYKIHNKGAWRFLKSKLKDRKKEEELTLMWSRYDRVDMIW